MCHFTAKLLRLPQWMIILKNDRGELYIMVTLRGEQAVTVAKGCSGRRVCVGKCTSAFTSARVCVCTWTRAALSPPGCWSVLVL